MPKLRNIIALLLIAWGFWHFYGEDFQHSGFTGVYEEISTDINNIRQDPTVIATIESINQGFQDLVGNIKGEQESPQSADPGADKPHLEAPEDQSFSIHNVEIGDDRSKVEEITEEPQRSTVNEYGVEWVTYHENYHNFFMAAFDEEGKVAGLYTNQDLLTSEDGIAFDSNRDAVLSALGDPLTAIRKGAVRYQIQSDEEYDTFLIDENYVTIFYDKHENNTVTAVQIISEELEQQKNAYYTAPDGELKEGLEYQLFDLTNAVRVVHGLPVLEWNEPLQKTAEQHSSDMAENNYFSHTNLDGQSPFDRMAEDDIAFRTAGENLATGQPSSIFAHEGLMNSMGHRENILQANYETLAVGVSFGENNRPYYTENFVTE
ncbi:CAP domain-containing protein [Oceanobacillus jordanicus]|uniref:CAP domain-containing protein n=1 Tax=Oceanobacillus jordanicus TaxID=2867266 RepID=A0AAW5B4J4_9BACI|nr:CAP domain-containing protein [Oceanobacillus jordanicus]MCG3418347.1 CAP domain-containing protein [Oceanobacillus jordanicus]